MRNRKWRIRVISLLFLGAAGIIVYKVGLSVLVVSHVIHQNKLIKAKEFNEFSDVTYTSFDKNSNQIQMTSSKIKESNKEIFDFSDMKTTFNISPNETATIIADQTHFVSRESKQCNLKGNVKLTTEGGLILETKESFIDIDNKIAKGNTDVTITEKDVKLVSKKYHFDLEKKIVTLITNVKGKINNDQMYADKLIIEFKKSIGKDIKKIQAFGNSSYVTSQYDLKAKDKIIYEVNHAEAYGDVNLKFRQNRHNYLVKSNSLLFDFNNNIIKKVNANKKLIIYIDNSTVIRGDSGVLEHDLLTITGNTVISNEKGNIICKKAILNTRTNDIKIYNSKGVIKKN